MGENNSPTSIISKEIKEARSKYKRKKILSVAVLAIILVIGVGFYFYFQTGFFPQTNKTETNLPKLSEQFAETDKVTEKSLPPLSEVSGEENSGEKPLPLLSE